MVSKSGCLGWFQKRTNLEKTLLSVSSLLLLTVLLMILFGVAFQGKKSDKMTDENPMCWTRECIETAGEIISTMDHEADTCRNFYDFSCGNYQQQTSSVSKRSRDSLYFSLKNLMESSQNMEIQGFDDIRRFYNSCVKFGTYRQDVDETKESFLNLMSELGVGIWPIIDPLYDVEKFNLEHTLSSLTLLDIPVVFQMEVIPDQLLKGSYLIKISPGGPRESGRNPSEIRDDVQLRTSVLTSLLLIGASSADTNVNDILSTESNFAVIEQDKSTVCDENILAPQEAISELNRLIPEIDWSIIFSEIRNATGLVRPFAVELHCKQKIRDYVVHLNDLSLRSEANYLGWRFFSKFVDNVIPTFERAQFGHGEPIPRWRFCLELLEKYSRPVLTEALTKKIVNKETQYKIEKISNAVLSATQHLLSQARWLSESQKKNIREKVTRIKMMYPFQATASSGNLPVNMPEVDVKNFTAVTIRLHREWVIKRFKKLLMYDRMSDDAESWTSMVSSAEDATPSDYIILAYFDKIQNPYIRLHESEWMNFGGYGMFVAREISKILLDMNLGTSANDVVNVGNLWTEYRNFSLCVGYYERYLDKHLQIISAHKALNMIKDIFLDHSSIEIAYEAAKSTASSYVLLPALDLSKEKMFFLSYVQTLCDGSATSESSENIPLKERYNLAVSSVKAFNEVFKCSHSMPYCEIWT